MDKGWAIGQMVLINGQIRPTWQQTDFCSQEWKLMCLVFRTNDDLLLTFARGQASQSVFALSACSMANARPAMPNPTQTSGVNSCDWEVGDMKLT